MHVGKVEFTPKNLLQLGKKTFLEWEEKFYIILVKI